MNYSSNYKDIPDSVKNRLAGANMFYTPNYEKNVILRGQSVLYLWDEAFILVARIRKRSIFKVSILDTEPYAFFEGSNEQLFLDKAMQVLKENKVSWSFNNTTSRFHTYPHHSSVVPSGDYILDLTLSEDALWNNVHSKHRNSIRRGEKDGLEIIIGGEDLLKEYVPLSNETYERSNVSDGGYDYYKGLIEGLGDFSRIMLVKNKEEVQSGCMFYYNQSMAYYVHGASIRRPSPGATNYLLWKAVLYFKEMGVEKFSFVGYHYQPEEGSKLEGIQRFKERFGGPLEDCYNFRHVHNKLIYNIYCLFMQFKNCHVFSKYQDSIDKQIKKYHYTELNKD